MALSYGVMNQTKDYKVYIGTYTGGARLLIHTLWHKTKPLLLLESALTNLVNSERTQSVTAENGGTVK